VHRTSGLADQGQRGKPGDPIVRRNVTVDIAPQRLAVCAGDRATMKVCIGESRPVCQQIFERNRTFQWIRCIERSVRTPQVKPGASFAEIMRAMAEATIAAIPDRSTAVVGRLTGLAYAMTDEKMRAQVTQITAESYAFGEEWLRAVTNAEDLPMPTSHLVRVLHALIEGLVLQRLLTPGLVPDRVIREAFTALAMKSQKR
jgi:hypothetical protein